MTTTIRKNVYVGYLVQAVGVVVNFVYSLIIVRLLGANGFGEYSIFNNSLAFSLILLGFNLPSVLVFYITNRRIDASRLLNSAVLATFVLALVLGIVLWRSRSLGLSMHIFPGGDNKPLWIFFFVTLFFLMQVVQLFTAFLNGHRVFIPVSYFILAVNLLMLLFWGLYVLHIFGTGTRVFDLVWWVNIALNLACVLYLGRLVLKQTGFKMRLSFMSRREWTLIGGFAAIVYVCNSVQFLIYRMDVWFIHYFHGNVDTGIYALALSLSQLIWVLPNAVSTVLLNYYQVHKRQESIDLGLKYGSFSLYFSLISALILSLLYYFALPWVYGPQFDAVFRMTILLFIGAVPFSMAITVANLNSGIGFVRVNLYATIFIFVLGLVMDIILIPSYGINGAIVAKVLVYICGVIFHIIAGKAYYGLPWTQLLRAPRMSDLKRLISSSTGRD